ncbi:hypothetical protein CcaCcLH18_03044 [Colletotrichum camelliae]|nr:hypothetical protein CcaCcLH18_03044 [Colletotrichum camelliae]
MSDIDCVNAAVSSVSKALLILSEIKKTHKRCEDEEALGLENLQKALKVLKDELDDINGTVLEKHRAQVRARFLRLDRDFRTDVTEPLKTALLDKTMPRYPRIIAAVKAIQQDGHDVVRKLAAPVRATEESSDDLSAVEEAKQMA